MRKKPSLQEDVLTTALDNLKQNLIVMGRGEKQFFAHYRTARLHAFQLEFLAKFLRKADLENLEAFERLHVLAKDLEDRLGAFNEIDEMIVLCRKYDVHLPSMKPAVAHFESLRKVQYRSLTKWMKSAGWQGRDLQQVRAAGELIAQLEDLSEDEVRLAAAKKMVKVLKELQSNVDQGVFSPAKKSGYTLKEVESKVHELRREIRKVPMYASYADGLFALTNEPDRFSKKADQAQIFFSRLVKSPLVNSPFAKLPKPRVRKPLLISRAFFLAITKYVSELGFAKDWAQNIERLHEVGLSGEISFNQLDPALKDIFGRPEPLNTMVLRTIDEIRRTKIFSHMAQSLEAQARK